MVHTIAVLLPGGRLAQILVARSFRERLRGLIGYTPGCGIEGCLIFTCRAIHTLGMRFPIDVAWLDGGGRVVRVDRFVPPGLRFRACRRAWAALELWAGLAAGLEPGARIPIPAPRFLADLALDVYAGGSARLREAAAAFGAAVARAEFNAWVLRGADGRVYGVSAGRSPDLTLRQLAAAFGLLSLVPDALAELERRKPG